MLFQKRGGSLIIDMIQVLRDKVSDELLRHEIYLEIIDLLEESKIIGSLEALKGVDRSFDAAYTTYKAAIAAKIVECGCGGACTCG